MGGKPVARAPRFRVARMNAVYDTGEEFWSGPVVDVSESGLFIETAHELPQGTRVIIVPDGLDDTKLPFELRAQVVRVAEYDPENAIDRTPGIAFHWCDMSDEQVDQVRRYLEQFGIPARG